jgi:hypothetical protein
MMKNYPTQTHASRVLAASERYFGPLRSSSEPRQATVYQEMNLGAAVGLMACLAYACAAGAPAAMLSFAALVGFCAGAVMGLVLWSSSADLPEDPVLPPAPGQERIAPARR